MDTGSDADRTPSQETKADTPEKKPSFTKKRPEKPQWLARPLKRIWREVALFSALAWPGAAVGAATAVVALTVYVGVVIETGLGRLTDAAIATLLGALGFGLIGLVVILIATILRAWPRLFSGALLGAIAFLILLGGFFDFSPGFMLRFGSTPVLLLAALGAAIAIAIRRGPRKAKTSHRIGAAVLMIASIAVAVGLLVWLAAPGSDPYLETQRPLAASGVPQLNAPNPSETGGYKVATLFYGSGTDKRRPEYGEQVTLITDPVYASPFVKNLKGFKAKMRKLYWGFGAKEFP
ncbi:hypothetical protein AMJ85_05350, partial [candidate division BRC1 bacterium SM23_51]